jgi:hypothetical protein
MTYAKHCVTAPWRALAAHSTPTFAMLTVVTVPSKPWLREKPSEVDADISDGAQTWWAAAHLGTLGS